MRRLFSSRSRTAVRVFLVSAGVLGLALALPGFLPPPSQAFHASAEIGGYVYTYASSVPVPAATVKYCFASSWTALDSCTPTFLASTNSAGEWQLPVADSALYYRFWAVSSDGFYGASNSVSGSSQGTGHLILYIPSTSPTRGTLTVQKQGTGIGFVSATQPMATLDCGFGQTTCSAMYPAGAEVRLLATADIGNVFSSWSGNCTGTSPQCVYVIPGPSTYYMYPQFNTAGGGNNKIYGNVRDANSQGVSGAAIYYCSSSSGTPSTCTSASATSAGVTSSTTGYWEWNNPPTAMYYTFFAVFGGQQTNSASTNGAYTSGTYSLSELRFSATPADSGNTNYTLTVNKNGAGNVYVSPPGANCGYAGAAPPCSYSYASGTSVTLTAQPDTTGTFTGWSGDCSGTNATCTFTMGANKSAMAAFGTNTAPISASDLTVRDTALTPATGTAGSPMTFSAKVVNEGSVASISSVVRLYISGSATYQSDQGVGGLTAVTGNQAVSWQWTPNLNGNYYFNICADVTATNAESIEHNNCSGGSFAVGTAGGSGAIRGRVTAPEGQGISGVKIDAFMPEGSGFQSTTSSTDGSYQLAVAAGAWEISAHPDTASGYGSAEPFSQRVSVTAGGTVSEVNFVLQRADATISGRLIDASGNVLTNVNAGVYVVGQSIGAPLTQGTFTLRVPAGTHTVDVWLPYESGYVSAGAKTVTVLSGQPVSLDLMAIAQASGGKFEGAVVDTAGGAVVNAGIEVFAGSADRWIRGTIVPTTGRYSILVPPGTWQLGYRAFDSRYAATGGPVGAPVQVTVGAVVTRNIVLVAANTTINVQVRKSDGSAFVNAGVEVSATPFNPDIHTATEAFRAFTQADAQGTARFAVPAGTYYVRAFAPPDLGGGLNPVEQSVILASGETKALTLQFRIASATISGRVLAQGNAVAEAFIGGWTKTGGFAMTKTSADGSYRLSVTTGDVWNLKAGGNVGGVFYESEPISADMTARTIATQDVLLGLTQITIPPPITTSHTATQSFSRKLEDGMAVSCKESCFSASGTVSVAIQPDLTVPDQGTTKVIGIAYNIEAYTAAGTAIATLQGSATVTIPYQPDEVGVAGVAETELRVAFFDETTARWQILDTSVVDVVAKTVTATTTHLTRFALLTPAYSTVVSGSASGTIREGDLIRGPDGVKVYIVNDRGYKRHIFNPAVFGMYGHFRWDSIKVVSQATLDSYVVSDVYRVDGDPKVYSLEEVSEAQGSAAKHWLDTSAERFTALGYNWNQVFIVNTQERDYYQTGSAIQ
ncbi:MAG: carboxypeptidase regulatory-like domain-containing protein [Candidatus Terrybacteria bacterium]|nr:carboxypeptidase regulatory-like domain-containing protein [Candidatus Terrybacteria bacterium]